MKRWAAAATTLLGSDPAVEENHIVADVEDRATPSLQVEVIVASTDGDSAIELVEHAILEALYQAAGEGECGWMRHEWSATPVEQAEP